MGGNLSRGEVRSTFHQQCMDFVAVLIFTQQVFHSHVYFSFECLILGIFVILDQISACCLVLSIKKHATLLSLINMKKQRYLVFHKGDMAERMLPGFIKGWMTIQRGIVYRNGKGSNILHTISRTRIKVTSSKQQFIFISYF